MGTQLFHGYSRLGDFPLDSSSVFSTYALAEAYAASNETAYAGQFIAVVNITGQLVEVYHLRFPLTTEEITSGDNFILQGIGTDEDYVLSINDLGADETGNVLITGSDITISDTDLRTIAEALANIEVGRITGLITSQITDPSDAINLDLLRETEEDILQGINKTVKGLLYLEDRVYDDAYYDFQIGDIIRKVTVIIDTLYNVAVGINLFIGTTPIMTDTEIFEETAGTYVIEPLITLSSEGALLVTMTPESTTPTSGSATIYVDFTRNPYDSI